MFTIVLDTDNGVTYQWRLNMGVTSLSDIGPYSGVNTPTLIITDVDNSLEGDYSVQTSRFISSSLFFCSTETLAVFLIVRE